MASDQVQVQVTFREIPLFARAVLQTVSATGGFLHTESPMPIGTTLILSPSRAPDVKVVATVGLVVEACRGVKLPEGEQPGMNLVFEAGGELLLDHLEELAPSPPAEVVASPQPLPIPIPPARREPPAQAFEEVPTKVERRVAVSAPPEEAPALQPVASGSLTVEAAPPPEVRDEPSVVLADDPQPAGDPESPDKVVVEVDAEYTGEEEEEGDGEGGEGGEAEGDEKKKKKRSRGRRRKKR